MQSALLSTAELPADSCRRSHLSPTPHRDLRQGWEEEWFLASTSSVDVHDSRLAKRTGFGVCRLRGDLARCAMPICMSPCTNALHAKRLF